jgi:hypothetical protein
MSAEGWLSRQQTQQHNNNFITYVQDANQHRPPPGFK